MPRASAQAPCELRFEESTAAPARTGTAIAQQKSAPRKEKAMEFRWIAILSLWTMLVGPMLDTPVGVAKARSQPSRMQKTR